MLMNPYAYEMLVAALLGGGLLLWVVYRWVLTARRGSKPPLPPPVTAACRLPAPQVCRTKTGVVLTLVEDQTPPSPLSSGRRMAA